MKRTYYCLACGANLNPNVKIVMTLIKEGVRGLALFSPIPGNYKIILSDELTFRDGDVIDVHCPVCGVAMSSDVSPMLARVGFRRSDGTTGWADFSRKWGEQATFYVTDERVRSYGDNAELYGTLNFFGAGHDED